MPAAVTDIETPSANYSAQVASPINQGDVQVGSAKGSSVLGRARRCWAGIRWCLARTVFSQPLPLLTASFDVKLGDLLITLPACLLPLAYNAYVAAGVQVSETGPLPAIALLVVFVLTVRNNSLLILLTGISFERALLYHKIVAVLAVLLGGLHGLAYYFDEEDIAPAYNNRRLGRAPRLTGSSKKDLALSGLVLFFLMVGLLIFSLPPFRRRYYELFLRSHWLLFIGVVVFGVIHGAPQVLIGAGVWLADLLFRHAYVFARRFGVCGSNVGVVAPQSVRIRTLPGDIVRIEFQRDAFRFDAGQYVFLCIPALSALEWHPFTISSSPRDPIVTIHIKQLGDWTKRLAKLVRDRGSNSSDGAGCKVVTPFSVLVDGPYGNVTVDIESPGAYSHYVLLSGGVGITPMLSIVNTLHHEFSQSGGRRGILRRVHFVWAVRDRKVIDAFMNPSIGAMPDRLEASPEQQRFFPDRLVGDQQRSDAVFTAELYLTTAEQSPATEGQTEPPYVEWLQSNLRRNTRPDTLAILRSIGEDAKVKVAELSAGGKPRRARVAVLVCGPALLVSKSVENARRLTRELGVAFDVHTENFDF